MLHKTKGIVLRAVKYGETSLILNIFSEIAGHQSYMIKGVRNAQSKTKRAGLLQAASLLELVVEHKPNRQLQHIREFQPSHIYQSLQEEVIKNSIAIYSVELLSKLLPHEVVMEDLFHFAYNYFLELDLAGTNEVGNYPLFFTIQCGKYFGYNILGHYTTNTPYLDAKEGVFSAQPPNSKTALNDEEIKIMATIINEAELQNLHLISLNSSTRNKLLDWYIEFLQHHTQHLSNIRSLEILRTILH
jgi:DNA repair protein RecO (recombination protein O)